MTNRESLIALVRPPSSPKDNVGTWDDVEALLATPLPSDYRWLVETFGSGMFGTHLRIFNPFSSNPCSQLGRHVVRCCGILADLQGRDLGVLYGATSSFGRGRLLPCGEAADGDMLFWITLGDPEKWSMTVLRAPFVDEDRSRANFDEYPVSLVQFLVSACREGAGLPALRGAVFFPD
jgi:hypothetical protein